MLADPLLQLNHRDNDLDDPHHHHHGAAASSSSRMSLLTSARGLHVVGVSLHAITLIFVIIAMSVPAYLLSSMEHIGMFQYCYVSSAYYTSSWSCTKVPTGTRNFDSFRFTFAAAMVPYLLHLGVSMYALCRRASPSTTLHKSLLLVTVLAKVAWVMMLVSIVLFVKRYVPMLGRGYSYGWAFYAHIVVLCLHAVGTIAHAGAWWRARSQPMGVAAPVSVAARVAAPVMAAPQAHSFGFAVQPQQQQHLQQQHAPMYVPPQQQFRPPQPQYSMHAYAPPPSAVGDAGAPAGAAVVTVNPSSRVVYYQP